MERFGQPCCFFLPALLAFVLVGYHFYKRAEVRRMEEAVLETERENERLSSLLGEQRKTSDSLRRMADTLRATWLEEGREIIIEKIKNKYREDYIAISNAGADEQIRLLTEWLSKRRGGGR